MICAFLLHSGISKTASEALDLYSVKRTRDNKGVTIPSQRRYVEYYELVKPGGKVYTPVFLKPIWITFSPCPLVNGGNFTVSLVVYKGKTEIYRSEHVDVKKSCREGFKHKFRPNVPVISGDVRIEFKQQRDVIIRKPSIFSFWFNTFFVENPYPPQNVNGHVDRKSGQSGAHK